MHIEKMMGNVSIALTFYRANRQNMILVPLLESPLSRWKRLKPRTDCNLFKEEVTAVFQDKYNICSDQPIQVSLSLWHQFYFD